MAKHYSKYELLSMMKQVKKNENISKSASLCSWSTWANVFAYHFNTENEWDADKINTFFTKQIYYFNLLDDKEQWQIQKDVVESYVNSDEFKWYDDVTFDAPPVVSKNKAVTMLNMKNVGINNKYLNESFKFCISSYRALVDLVNSSEEFMMYYDGLETTRAKYYAGETISIFEIHQYLVDEAGIDLEMPTEESVKACMVC